MELLIIASTDHEMTKNENEKKKSSDDGSRRVSMLNGHVLQLEITLYAYEVKFMWTVFSFFVIIDSFRHFLYVERG